MRVTLRCAGPGGFPIHHAILPDSGMQAWNIVLRTRKELKYGELGELLTKGEPLGTRGSAFSRHAELVPELVGAKNGIATAMARCVIISSCSLVNFTALASDYIPRISFN